MTATAILIAAALLGHARAGVVELNCSDNATCIENMAREFVRSVRQQKTVRIFDALTIEPLGSRRQARSNEGLLSRFMDSHAFTFDWNDYSFRLWKAQERKDALDLEVFESRAAKDVSEDIPKKSKSKVEEEEVDDDDKKSPKGGIIKRRAKKKIMQAVIPMLFGMKTTGAVIFGLALVTVLTLKAWAASKVALMVTIGMAVKRLYESYSLGVGLQNHPYLYSQYPIDFPSASSHAYSVSGVSPQFSPEMYNPTALATHSQSELLQHNDASAQQSQQAPTLQLLNATRASERWDGKSKLQKLLEPIVDGIRSYIDPIANVFYAMPATFRGLNSDVTTMKNEPEPVEETAKQPREILVPQPRHIAQRKTNYRKLFRYRPKKYTELKVDLDKLKKNKDLYDYIKTKKYKYNYQNTYYYPRVKYFVNPNTFITKPKYSRLVPYKKEISSDITITTPHNIVNNTLININEWTPLLVPISNVSNIQTNVTKSPPRPFAKSIISMTKRKRVKRNIDFENNFDNINSNSNSPVDVINGTQLNDKGSVMARGNSNFWQIMNDADPVSAMVNQANKYTKSVIKSTFKSSAPPMYYTFAYEVVMMTLDIIDGLVEVHYALVDHFLGDIKSTHKKKKGIHTHGQQQHKKKKPSKKEQKKKKKKHGAHGTSDQKEN